MQTQDFHAVEYDGQSYDCGSKLGYLRANVAYALNDAGLGDEARLVAQDVLDSHKRV